MLPGIQLVIGLCHSTSSEKKTSQQSTPLPSKGDHDHVLEHSLHQLLREVHHKNTHHPFPHPASAPLGPSKKRYLAGNKNYMIGLFVSISMFKVRWLQIVTNC